MLVFQSQKQEPKTLSTWIWNQRYVFFTVSSPNTEMLPKWIAFNEKKKVLSSLRSIAKCTLICINDVFVYFYIINKSLT